MMMMWRCLSVANDTSPAGPVPAGRRAPAGQYRPPVVTRRPGPHAVGGGKAPASARPDRPALPRRPDPTRPDPTRTRPRGHPVRDGTRQTECRVRGEPPEGDG